MKLDDRDTNQIKKNIPEDHKQKNNVFYVDNKK